MSIKFDELNVNGSNYHMIIKWPTCEEKMYHGSSKKSPMDSLLHNL